MSKQLEDLQQDVVRKSGDTFAEGGGRLRRLALSPELPRFPRYPPSVVRTAEGTLAPLDSETIADKDGLDVIALERLEVGLEVVDERERCSTNG